MIDRLRRPLEVPLPVVRRRRKYFTISRNNKRINISIYCLKPAYPLHNVPAQVAPDRQTQQSSIETRDDSCRTTSTPADTTRDNISDKTETKILYIIN